MPGTSAGRQGPADSVQTGIFSGLDWVLTFGGRRGQPQDDRRSLKGKQIGGRTYKNDLDGDNESTAITGKGLSACHGIFYLGESTVGAVWIDDDKSASSTSPPAGWAKKPSLTCLHHQSAAGSVRAHGWRNNGTKEGSAIRRLGWNTFWRFVSSTVNGQGSSDLP